MDNLNELKKIWLTADTKLLPNAAEMVVIIKKFRNQKLRKIILIVAVAFVLCALMIGVMFFYRSTMLTTRIGEVCIIISSIILLATNLNSLNRFYKFKDYDNVDFIKFLETTRKRQIFYYTKTQVVALTFCSVGLVLYLIETALISTRWEIILYTFCVIYFVVIWLVVRPRMYKKQTKKMNETIGRYKLLMKQLENEN